MVDPAYFQTRRAEESPRRPKTPSQQAEGTRAVCKAPEAKYPDTNIQPRSGSPSGASGATCPKQEQAAQLAQDAV